MGDNLTWGILGCSKFALEHMLPAMQIFLLYLKHFSCLYIFIQIYSDK